MYRALYRKWRPKTFEEVVGQEHITTTLKNEIKNGCPSHAYLLMGSRGTGKTTCAKLIAKAVNCKAPKDGSPCGQCDICRGVDNGSMVDIVEIDAASNSGVDNIRDLRDEAVFLPNVTKYRVYIIDEAHMLSMGAVNALLKIMEEPPAHVIFILATTELHKIPATIQSRCQRFDFVRIDAKVIAQRLAYVAQQEGIGYEEGALELVARLADGGMRDALSLLDLCVAYNGTVTPEVVSRAAGLAGQEYLFDISKALEAGDVPGVLSIIQEVGNRGIAYDRLCQQLVTHYRNLLLAATVLEPGDFIVCLPEALEQYLAQGAQLSPTRLIYVIKTLQDAHAAMTRTTSRRTQLELVVIRLCDLRLETSTEALLARIEALEARLQALESGQATASLAGLGVEGDKTSFSVPGPAAGAGMPSRPAKASAASASPLPQPAPQQPLGRPMVSGTAASGASASGVSTSGVPASGESTLNTPTSGKIPPGASTMGTATAGAPTGMPAPSDGEALPPPMPQWEEILARLGHSNKALWGALKGSAAYLSGNRVLIQCHNPVFAQLMRSNEYTKQSLKAAIAEVTGIKYGIGPYLPPASGVEKPSDVQASPLTELLEAAREGGVEVTIQ